MFAPPSVSAIQEQIEKLDPSDIECRPLLRELLDHKDLKSHVQRLDGSELEALVELLDKVGKADTNIRRV